MKNSKKIYISLLMLAIVLLTIGYAFLNQNLKINGNTAIASNSWIIYFDNLLERPGTMSAATPARITNAEKTQIEFTIDFTTPGENYTFEVDIVNDGTIDAMINSVSLTGIPESLNGIIEWKANYLNGDELKKCDELLSNTSRRIRVTVNYNKDIDTLPDAQDLDLTFAVKYVQLDNSECSETNPSSPDPIDPDDGRHTLTIDPNYGIYDGTDDLTKIRMTKGQVYVFRNDPIQEGHTFTGWTVNSADTYNETAKIITMDEEDISAKANWTWDIIDPEHNLGNCFSVGGNLYQRFDTALDSISNTGTIKLISNSCSIDYEVTIPENKNVTFDLNGHYISTRNYIYNNGSLTIIDSSNRKRGSITSESTESFNGPTIFNTFLKNEGRVENQPILNILDTKINCYVNDVCLKNYGGFITIDGGEYFSENDFLLTMNSDGTIPAEEEINGSLVKNATININNTQENKDLQIINMHGGINTYQNNIINAKIKSGFITALAEHNGKTATIISNLEINAESEGNTGFYGIYMNSTDLDNIKINLKSDQLGIVYGLFYPNTIKENISITDFEMNIEANKSANQISPIYKMSGTNCRITNLNTDIKIKEDNTGEIYPLFGSNIEGDQVNININAKGGTIRPINTPNGRYTNVDINVNAESFNSIYAIDDLKSITNSKITINAKDGNYVYGGQWSDEVDNVDFEIKTENISQGVYGLVNGNLKYKNSSMNIENHGSTKSYYGIYTSGELENVNIKIDQTDENASGTQIYAINADNIDIKDSKIEITDAGQYMITGVMAKNLVSENTDYIINSSYVPKPKYVINTSGTSSINGGLITLNGPEFEGSQGMDFVYAINNSGSITIDNVNVTSAYSGITHSGNNNLEIKNSSVNARDWGIKNTANAIIENTNVAVKTMFGIYTPNGNLDIISGNITGNSLGVNFTSSGILTIGKKDGNIEETPVIKGEQLGLNVSGTNAKAYFYDGIIKGISTAIGGKPFDEYEAGSHTVTGTETIDDKTYNTIKLSL